MFYIIILYLYQQIYITNTWILHHTNAPYCHRVFCVTQFLTSKIITVLLQPLYSSNLSPYNFFLFPRVKQVVKRTNFESVIDIQLHDEGTLGASSQCLPEILQKLGKTLDLVYSCPRGIF